MEKKCELRDNLRGVRTGFELARRMTWEETLAKHPVRAMGMTAGFWKSESVRIRADYGQLYPLGQLLGPLDLGQPYKLKA